MLILGALIISITTSAHAPSTYWIMLREDGPIPENATENLYVNDSVWFRNVDSRENITHTISIDIDNDGNFTGKVDVQSKPLTSFCDRNEEGNKSDKDCEVVFKITFNLNSTYLSGNYSFEDRRSDGNVSIGRLYVRSDIHLQSENNQTVKQITNDTNEVDSVNVNTQNLTEEKNNQNMIAVSIISAMAAISLLGVLSILTRRGGLNEIPIKEQEE